MSSPIQHVVIIVKENHTFDNYFGTFPGANGVTLPQAPDPQKTDPRHDHVAWLAGSGVKTQYKQSDISTYWAYAEQYTLCDNYFTDVASQSEPNHLHTFAAFSPVIDNTSNGRNYQPQPPFDIESLPAVLEASGHTWRDYADSNSSYFPAVKALAASPSIVPASQFLTDVAAGFLPTVSWLYAPSGLSEHPGGTTPLVGPGMKWTADRVQAIANSPLWPTTAIFITWDDWGGWFDHVTPPLAQRWSGGGPTGYANSQFRYGNRVPCLVISPYARQAVNHDFFSHASLVKFCLRLFGLASWNVPALAPGDPSGDMWSCFDFGSPPRLGVPSMQPAAAPAPAPRKRSGRPEPAKASRGATAGSKAKPAKIARSTTTASKAKPRKTARATPVSRSTPKQRAAGKTVVRPSKPSKSAGSTAAVRKRPGKAASARKRAS